MLITSITDSGVARTGRTVCVRPQWYSAANCPELPAAANHRPFSCIRLRRMFCPLLMRRYLFSVTLHSRRRHQVGTAKLRTPSRAARYIFSGDRLIIACIADQQCISRIRLTADEPCVGRAHRSRALSLPRPPGAIAFRCACQTCVGGRKRYRSTLVDRQSHTPPTPLLKEGENFPAKHTSHWVVMDVERTRSRADAGQQRVGMNA